MSKQLLITINLVLIGFTALSQVVIEPCKQGTSLITAIQNSYTPNSVLGYNKARDTMYAVIDNDGSNNVHCIYTQFSVTWNPTQDPSSNVYQNGAGINAEHVYPQSKGASSEPAKSDIHNLYPAQVNVNSSRQSSIFAEIDDNDTDRWYRLGVELTTTPTSNIDEYSEREIQNGTAWEPREDAKGNIARAVFYFYTIYQTEANAADATYFDNMKSTLIQWHYADPADAEEIARSTEIASYQGNENPFVLDSSLARRAYFLPDASYPNGDPNCFSIPSASTGSDSVLIVEIADPSDVYEARFVSIQNKSTVNKDISGWAIRKYSNGQTTFSEEILPATTILAPNEIYVTAYNTTNYNAEYGQNPDNTNGTVINGNGDDVYTLADATGSNIDIYGVIGVDGSGENWEYENDFVVRKATVFEPTTTFDINEWDIYTNYTTANILGLSQSLPVELLYFDGFVQNGKVNLEWQTANEENNAYFEVERSTNGIDFKRIGQVEGNGNSTEINTYSFVDNQPINGKNYYRLRQVDLDGNFEIHPIIEFSIEKYLSDLNIVPNPVYHHLNINFEKIINQTVYINIINTNGQTVYSNQFNVSNDLLKIDASNLSSGIYFIKIQSNEEITTKRFIKH